MNATRRDFLEGTLASLGLGMFGERVFAAPPGWKPRGTARIVFGVLSDTHLLSRPFSGKPVSGWSHEYLYSALNYFKSQKADAVVHCGDFAHRGRFRELEFHAWAWNKVFPKNRRTDGREVAKLFVSGNHDFRMDCAGRGFATGRAWPAAGRRYGVSPTSRSGTRRSRAFTSSAFTGAPTKCPGRLYRPRKLWYNAYMFQAL